MITPMHVLATFAVGLVAAWSAATVPPTDPREVVGRQIRAEAERIKQQLTDLERATDYGSMLERKLTVDSSLIPAWLLEDATAFCAAVDEGREPPDILRLMRVEYSSGPVRSVWSHPDGARAIAASLRDWCAPADGRAAFVARTAGMRAPDGEHAPFIQWTVEVVREGGATRTTAESHWFEPCLAATALDWPLTPHGLRVSWDSTGGEIALPTGATHVEAWPHEPVLNNAWDMYVLFDALRATRCKDAQVVAGDVAVNAGRAAGEAAIVPLAAEGATEHTVAPTLARTITRTLARTITRTIARPDGSVVRTETWTLLDGKVTELAIDQPALRLVHHSAETYEVRTEVEGATLDADELHHPRTELAYPPGGMRITVGFRPASAILDSLMAQGDGATVPSVVQIEAGGRVRATAHIAGVAAGTGLTGPAGHAGSDRRAAPAGPDDGGIAALRSWKEAARSGAQHRSQSVSAIADACAAGDVAVVQSECEHLARLALAEDVPAAWTRANFGLAAACLRSAGFERESLMVRGGAKAREGDASLFAEGAVPADGADGTAAADATRAAGAAGGPDDASLSPAREAFVAGIRRGLGAFPSSQQRMGAVHALEQAARAAMLEAPPAWDAAVERMTPMVERDLRALIEHGSGEFARSAMLDPRGVESAAAHFRGRLERCLQGEPVSTEGRAQSQATVRLVASVARDVAAGLARERSVGTAEEDLAGRSARAGVIALEPLAGNCLDPTLVEAWTRAEQSAAVTAAALAVRLKESPMLSARVVAADASWALTGRARHVREGTASQLPGAGVAASRAEEIADAVSGAARAMLTSPAQDR